MSDFIGSMPDASSLFRTHRLTMSDGACLTVYASEQVDLPVVILVNAYGMPIDFMVPLAASLRDRARVVTWDTRMLPSAEGVDPKAECGVARQVSDLWEIVRALNIEEPVAVAGWCTGASIALEAAIDTDRVKSLVLMNGAFYLGKRRKSGFERTMEMVMPLVAEDASYAAMLVTSMRTLDAKSGDEAQDGPRRPSSSVVNALDPELAHLTGQPYKCVDHLQRYARLLEAFLTYRPSEQALKAARSALIVTGMRDGTIHPSSSVLLHEQCPGSVLLTDDEGDHYMLLKNRDVIERMGAHLLHGLTTYLAA